MIEIFDNCASKTFYIIRSIYTLDVIGIIRFVAISYRIKKKEPSQWGNV